MSELLELADRCEKAPGPNRELDIRIAKAVGRYGSVVLGSESVRFTHSIDAAMTLVPEEWRFIIDSDSCHCRMTRVSRQGRDVTGFAGTMALALCAAALRALTHQTAEQRDGD